MRFSTPMLVASAAALLTSCAYIIPPAENAPRHNEVRGEMRRPTFNTPYSGGPQSGMVTPHDPRTALAAPMVARVPPAETVAVAELPPLTVGPAPYSAAYNAEAARRVPLENRAFETAAMGFDPITHVPPHPEVNGPNSSFDALRATQSEMEQTRMQAYEARDALARDAAAEPSLLSPLPRATIPPSPRRLDGPATIVPSVGQPHSAMPVPLGVAVAAEDMVFPPPPEPLGAYPLAEAPLEAPMAAAPVAVAPLVTASAPQPGLRVPVQNPTYVPPRAGDFDPHTPTVSAVGDPATVRTAAPPVVTVRGDFDPLAVANARPMLAAPMAAVAPPPAASASRYAASGLIAPSRYATRRF